MADLLARYALFSGCAIEHIGAPARHATIALARTLGIELWETPARGCCGARADRPLSEAALRQLLEPLTETTRQGLATVCLSPGCRQVIASQAPAPERDTPGADAGAAPPLPTLDCLHLFEQDEITVRLTRSRATSLSPLRVALHGACHGDHISAAEPAAPSSDRPGVSDAEQLVAEPAADSAAPATRGQSLANLIAMAGAEALEDVSVAGRCVEAPLLPASATPEAGAPACLALAARVGAEVVVTPCFLCFGELNERQRHLDRADPARSVPVLHLAHLLGVACGVAPLPLELGRLTVSARRVLAPFVR